MWTTPGDAWFHGKHNTPTSLFLVTRSCQIKRGAKFYKDRLQHLYPTGNVGELAILDSQPSCHLWKWTQWPHGMWGKWMSGYVSLTVTKNPLVTYLIASSHYLFRDITHIIYTPGVSFKQLASVCYFWLWSNKLPFIGYRIFSEEMGEKGIVTSITSSIR